MRFLVDESLSARVADLLIEAGHDVVHVSQIGLLGAEDPAVMRAAADADRILLSADTDFGELLALGRHPGPSVVLYRRGPRRPDAQVSLLVEALPAVLDSLAAGAVVVLAVDHVRIRMLPIDQ